MNVVQQIIESFEGSRSNEAICAALGSWTWDDPFKEEWRSFIALRWIELWSELSCETRLALFAEASVACMKRNNLRERGLHEVWRGKGEPLELREDGGGEGEWLLINDKTGHEIDVGDGCLTSRDEICTLVSVHPPHKPEAGGKVTVEFPEDGTQMTYYASVINAHFVKAGDKGVKPQISEAMGSNDDPFAQR